jgi:hypothetical protein
MTKYENGRIPDAALVTLDSGPKHKSSPKGAAMWYALRKNVQDDYGITLHITPGWNGYRPYDVQVTGRKAACAQGNCNAAALPGWSSHGGTWWDWRKKRWVDAMAFDIGDWWQLTKDEFYRQARKVGFEPGLITPAVAGVDEVWHLIVPDPWGAVPASVASKPVETKPEPDQEPDPEEEDEDMDNLKGAYYTRKSDKKDVYILFNTTSGFYMEHSGVTPGEYNNPIAEAWGTGAWPKITEAHAVVLKRGLGAVQRTTVTGSLSVDITEG